MSIREDIQAYLADYRGVLGWNSYKEPLSGSTIPHIEIPLYLKEATMPIRNPKFTEISTVQTKDPGTGISTVTNVAFFGAPDLLQTQLSGWTITPTNENYQWVPVDINNSPLNFGQINYNDIIRYYIAGRFNRNSAGAWERKDPDYYISPRGQKYSNPVIAVFHPQGSPNMKKQAFEMTLLLET